MSNPNPHPKLRLPNRFKYILVDIHGVLTDGQERKRFLKQMSTDYGMDYEKHNSLWANHIEALDIGQETAAEYLALVNSIFHTQISVDDYYRAMAKQIKTNQVLLGMLQKLSKDHQVCIVSDNLHELAMCLKPIFGSYFKQFRQFYSYEFGRTKAGGLFEFVLQALKAEPSEYLFFDDSIRNVDAAKTLGIKALQFTTNEQFFKDLTVDMEALS
jgi:HAD superfamily hydrolase (TIGR01509 family)